MPKRSFIYHFIPESIVVFKEGYRFKTFLNDLQAGATVGVIAVSLAMAFAIASGVPPERGLYTAIVAGFLISLLGGSRVQVGGPTGAFVVIIYGVVQKHGYDGLVLATLIAGGILILCGLLRLGKVIRYIPDPVTTGFTSAIALVIFTSQVKDFFGLHIENMPVGFISKWQCYCEQASTYCCASTLLAVFSLTFLIVMQRKFPRFPAGIAVIVVGSFIVWIFGIDTDTIGSRYNGVPAQLPSFQMPVFSLEKAREVFPDGITIALLAGIESLLSAMIADGMTGHRHRSNCELVAQGFANIGSVLFGGIPATGAIARTATNIRCGATTPVAGIVHSIVLAAILLLCAPLASQIPLAVLSTILVMVAWNMSEAHHFVRLLKAPWEDVLVLLTTFFLVIFTDLTVGVEVGILLSISLFIKRMGEHNEAVKTSEIFLDSDDGKERADPDAIYRKDVPERVLVYEINCDRQLKGARIGPRRIVLHTCWIRFGSPCVIRSFQSC